MINVSEAYDKTNTAVLGALNGVSGLGGMTAHLAGALGKGIRTLVLLNAAADAAGGVPENAIKAAAAVELLHMATLVHDDVIDDAETRRGIQTVHKKYGARDAVLCGDYLLCMSLTKIAAVDVESKDYPLTSLVSRFSRALGSICHGEYLQRLNNGDVDMNLFTYFKIISGKTAALFYIAANVGGVIGGEDEARARALGRFGQYMGMAFQILDDCKDYELTEAEAQKPVGNDISGGVITLPLILAVRENPALRDLALDAISGGDAARLKNAVRGAGGPDAARAVARRYAEKARRVLNGINEEKRRRLMEMFAAALSPSERNERQ